MTTTTPTGPSPLPGLETPDPHRPEGRLERAIRRTIAYLDGEGHVSEKDAARLELALVMCDVLETKRRSGRGLSTIGMDARVLMELLDNIVADADSTDDTLRDTLEAWSSAIADYTGTARAQPAD